MPAYMKRVVITGVGVISPLGIGAGPFWTALLAGTSAVRRISLFDPTGFPSRIAGEVPHYKIGDFVPKSYRKATKVMARDIELAVVAADDAIKDAGLRTKAHLEAAGDATSVNGDRFGCNIGAGLISVDLNELTSAMWVARSPDNAFDLRKWGEAGMGQLTPLWLLKYLPNMLACHVTIIHGLKGPSNTITCADASSHLAIGEAFRTIQRGAADLAICGGAESKVTPMALTRQCLLGRVTTSGEAEPARAVRPFDHAASGTAIAEGGGLLVLEEYEHARKRNARIYAEVVGFGASQDAYSVTEPDPSGHSYGKALAKALKEAAVTPEQVALLIPHGLGIPAFDRAELAGLKAALGSAISAIPVAPIKGQIGNLAAGSGVDVAAAVLGLHNGVVPAAVNSSHAIDPALNLSSAARDLKGNVAVSTVYSLGGQNACLVFRKV
jgi:3-oxoacyl-[acyl-carrier-protein] synthase II